MGRHADLAEPLKYELRDSVVNDALAINLCMFLIVEGRSVILEMLDKRSRFRAFVQDLALPS